MGSLEILITTFKKNRGEIPKIVETMNIQTSFLLRDQCSDNDIYTFENEVGASGTIVLRANEVGVSKNRNELLNLSKADFIIFADDDLIFNDNIHEKITSVMESTPFDAIKFIVNIKNKTRIAPKNIYRGKKRLSYFDCTDVGPWAYCFKRKFLVDNNIRFNENIGPGTGVIKSGEDVLFIRNFFKKGGKMGSSPLVIGDVLQEESTWYEGFNDSFLINEGGIYYLLYKPFHFAFYIRHIILHKNDYNTGLFRALKLMIEGKRAAKAFLKNG